MFNDTDSIRGMVYKLKIKTVCQRQVQSCANLYSNFFLLLLILVYYVNEKKFMVFFYIESLFSLWLFHYCHFKISKNNESSRKEQRTFIPLCVLLWRWPVLQKCTIFTFLSSNCISKAYDSIEVLAVCKKKPIVAKTVTIPNMNKKCRIIVMYTLFYRKCIDYFCHNRFLVRKCIKIMNSEIIYLNIPLMVKPNGFN